MNTEEGKRLADTVSTSFGEAQNASNSMNANLQSSESFREFASYSEDQAATIDRNATQDFVDWLAQQPLQSGQGGMGVQQAEVMLRQNPQLAQSYAHQFVEEATCQKMSKWKSHNINQSSVNMANHHYQQQLPQANLQGTHKSWSEEMMLQAHEENIKFGMTDKQSSVESEKIIDNIEYQMTDGRKNMHVTEDKHVVNTETMMHKHARGTDEEK